MPEFLAIGHIKKEEIMARAILYIGISCWVFLLAAACTSVTTTPHLYTNNENTELEILGEVVYESGDRTGYSDLLRAARNLYLDCDYVIDIMIDRRETVTSFPLFDLIPFLDFKPITKITWIMRGTAVKYAR